MQYNVDGSFTRAVRRTVRASISNFKELGGLGCITQVDA